MNYCYGLSVYLFRFVHYFVLRKETKRSDVKNNESMTYTIKHSSIRLRKLKSCVYIFVNAAFMCVCALVASLKLLQMTTQNETSFIRWLFLYFTPLLSTYSR